MLSGGCSGADARAVTVEAASALLSGGGSGAGAADNAEAEAAAEAAVVTADKITKAAAAADDTDLAPRIFNTTQETSRASQFTLCNISGRVPPRRRSRSR